MYFPFRRLVHTENLPVTVINNFNIIIQFMHVTASSYMKDTSRLILARYKQKHLTISIYFKARSQNSSRLSVRPSVWNNSAPIGWIFMKFYILGFFGKILSRKLKFL